MENNKTNKCEPVGAPCVNWHDQLIDYARENNSRFQSLIERLVLKVDALRGSTPTVAMPCDKCADCGFEETMRAEMSEFEELLRHLDEQVDRLF